MQNKANPLGNMITEKLPLKNVHCSGCLPSCFRRRRESWDHGLPPPRCSRTWRTLTRVTRSRRWGWRRRRRRGRRWPVMRRDPARPGRWQRGIRRRRNCSRMPCPSCLRINRLNSPWRNRRKPEFVSVNCLDWIGIETALVIKLSARVLCCSVKTAVSPCSSLSSFTPTLFFAPEFFRTSPAAGSGRHPCPHSSTTCMTLILMLHYLHMTSGHTHTTKKGLLDEKTIQLNYIPHKHSFQSIVVFS